MGRKGLVYRVVDTMREKNLNGYSSININYLNSNIIKNYYIDKINSIDSIRCNKI